MKAAYLLPVLTLITACATTNSQQQPLYMEFSQYSEKVNAQNIKTQYQNYFTQSPLAGESLDDPDVIDHLLFPRYMKTQTDSFEKTDKATGCLTVNGVSNEDEPMTFSLEYAATNNGWRINKILMAFFEDSTALPAQATCPNELRERSL